MPHPPRFARPEHLVLLAIAITATVVAHVTFALLDLSRLAPRSLVLACALAVPASLAVGWRALAARDAHSVKTIAILGAMGAGAMVGACVVSGLYWFAPELDLSLGGVRLEKLGGGAAICGTLLGLVPGAICGIAMSRFVRILREARESGSHDAFERIAERTVTLAGVFATAALVFFPPRHPYVALAAISSAATIAALCFRRDLQRRAWLLRAFSGHDAAWRVVSDERPVPGEITQAVGSVASDALLCRLTLDVPYRDTREPIAWVGQSARETLKPVQHRLAWTAAAGFSMAIALIDALLALTRS